MNKKGDRIFVMSSSKLETRYQFEMGNFCQSFIECHKTTNANDINSTSQIKCAHQQLPVHRTICQLNVNLNL